MIDQLLPPLIVIVGPTGVGKTEVAIRLASQFDGEIISADSRQVYRLLNIGTAKPTDGERQTVRHHLIDILDPDQSLTLAEYQALAYRCIGELHQRTRLPFLVGGTGQYVRAVVEGWNVPHIPPMPALRLDLESYADMYGAHALHARLAEADSIAANAIDPRNVRRVVRALEVMVGSGRAFSDQKTHHPPPYRIFQIGLTRPRETLYQRVDARIDRMMQSGLLDEVRDLIERGYGWELPSMSGLGYAQFAPYLGASISLSETVTSIRRETRRYVRHQYNWFQLTDPAMNWFDLDEVSVQSIADSLRNWLAEN